MCRWCKYYRPDERFRGIIGWCELHCRATDVKSSCEDGEDGTQMWMNGEEVKE